MDIVTVQDELHILQEILQDIISKYSSENKGLNIIANMVLNSISSNSCQLDDVIASGGSIGGESGITLIKGFEYLIQHTNEKDVSNSLFNAIEAWKLTLDCEQDENLSDKIQKVKHVSDVPVLQYIIILII